MNAFDFYHQLVGITYKDINENIETVITNMVKASLLAFEHAEKIAKEKNSLEVVEEIRKFRESLAEKL